MTSGATSRPLTERRASLGALLRGPYERMSDWVYGRLVVEGFAEMRPAFSAVLRNLPDTPCKVTELAARAGMTKQGMGYLVEQMRQAGLVDVMPDANDRRAHAVRLTARGTRVIDKAFELSRRYEDHLKALMGDTKAARLRSLLEEANAGLASEPAPRSE